MVKIANWEKSIKEYQRNEDFLGILNFARFRIFYEYNYEQVSEFYEEYYELYQKVYKYFNPFYDIIFKVGGDDTWSDFLSSVIGRGKDFLINAINNPISLKGMDYMENFGYLLLVDEDEYYNIKFDGSIEKYNL